MKNIMFENKTSPFTFRIDPTLSPTPHFHKDIEMVYVIDGECQVFADRKRDIIKNGDIFVSFPNQIHYYECSRQGQYFLVILSPEILFEVKSTMYDNIPKSNIIHNVGCKKFMNLLLDLPNIDCEYSQTVIAGILNQALAYLLPEFDLNPRIKTSNTTLQEVLNYCSTNFANDITLDDIAEALHISKFHISHLLNDKLGLSFSTYLNSLRINEACDLLEDTDKKIADISEEVGFGSIRSFNRTFSTTMNMSPLQYRSRFKIKN